MFQGDILEQYGVIWIAHESLPTYLRSLEGSIDYTFSFAEMEGTVITERGPYKHIIHNGYEMIYQTFNIKEQGFAIPGIIGARFCEYSDKYIQFLLIYLSDFENPGVDSQELEQKWLGYLELLTCNKL